MRTPVSSRVHLDHRDRAQRALCRWAAWALLPAMLAACGGAPRAPDDTQAQEDAVVEVGDVRVRATAMPTRNLGEAVARQHGISRSDDTVLLLVSVRRGADEATARSLPARVTAVARDLRGNRQVIAMRALRSGDGAEALVDSVGVADVDAPDTLRFQVDVAYDGGQAQLVFVRDFLP